MLTGEAEVNISIYINLGPFSHPESWELLAVCHGEGERKACFQIDLQIKSFGAMNRSN